jgi:lysophospholipase L1-like esterase
MMHRACLLVLVAICVLAPAAGAEDVIRLLPLGDSITYGVRAESQAGYRRPLGRLLEERGIAYRFVGTRGPLHGADRTDLPHNGYSGYSIQAILTALRGARVFSELAERGDEADIVLLHVGTNNLGPPEGTLDGAVDELRALLRYLDERRGSGLAPDARVLAAKIIPHTRGAATFDLALVTRTQLYNVLLEELVDAEFSHMASVVDMFQIPIGHVALYRLAVVASALDPTGDGHVSWLRFDGQPAERGPVSGRWYINTLLMTELRPLRGGMTYDGVHPTVLGYEVMAHQWLAHIVRLVR